MTGRDRPWAEGPAPGSDAADYEAHLANKNVPPLGVPIGPPAQPEHVAEVAFDHPETEAEPEGPTFDELRGDGEQIIRIEREPGEEVRISEHPPSQPETKERIRVARPAGFGPPPSPTPIGYAADPRRRPGRGIDRTRNGTTLRPLAPQTILAYAMTFLIIAVMAALAFVLVQGLLTHAINPFGIATPVSTAFGPR